MDYLNINYYNGVQRSWFKVKLEVNDYGMALLEDCFCCSLAVAASVIGIYTLVS